MNRFSYCSLLSEQVTYQADQFLDKNKDYVIAEHQALLNDSTCSFVANLFPSLPDETSKQSKFSSIGTRFKVGENQQTGLAIYQYYVTFLFIYLHGKIAATVTIINGNPEHNGATLHQMCEAKHSSETWNI